MSTPDIRETLEQAQVIVDRADNPTAARGSIAAHILPDHKPHTARIRTIEWLNGKRTPTDFAVCTRLVAWVKANKRRKNFSTK